MVGPGAPHDGHPPAGGGGGGGGGKPPHDGHPPVPDGDFEEEEEEEEGKGKGKRAGGCPGFHGSILQEAGFHGAPFPPLPSRLAWPLPHYLDLRCPTILFL